MKPFPALVLPPALAQALPAYAAGAAAPAAVEAVSLLQGGLALVLVLALVGVAAWLLKRFALSPGGASGVIKVVSAAAVGQRERVVVVEIGSTWLVLGVAPGQVRALHSLPKPEGDLSSGAPSAAKAGFPAWLRQATEKRHGK